LCTQTNRNLGLLLHDRALRLCERLQTLAREPMDEDRHEDVDPRLPEQISRLRGRRRREDPDPEPPDDDEDLAGGWDR
jgi:hypothetical protein